jgi:DNA-binding transcriptional MerR regulator
MKYRVDELAARAGTSVDTVRFYQSRGLLPAPERDGRIAWYSDDHLALLRRIRALKDNGFTLGSIKRMLDGDLDVADEALASALAEPAPGDGAGELLTLDRLAELTGVSPALLAALQREGLLEPVERDGEALYSAGDARTIAAGLTLLDAGLPLGELLALARAHDRVMRGIAEQAVELFARFVRDPIRAAASSEEEAAERLVEAFRTMLPATSALVASHFERVLLAAARRRMEEEGSRSELDAVTAEDRRSSQAEDRRTSRVQGHRSSLA